MNKFSVLISVYYKERAEYLQAALNSVFAQTLSPSEVVLVKDGPLGSELEDVIAGFSSRYPSQMKVVVVAQNVGLGQALNIGLSHCTYDLIARMDSDDLCVPDRFEKQVEIFATKTVDVVSAWIEEFDELNNSRIKKLPEYDEDIKRYAIHRCPIHHPCVMFRKEKVMEAGSYQHFYLLEDYYLWLRMIKSGAIFYNIQEPILRFRSTSDMFRRRGGLKYAKSEYRLFKYMYKSGMIGLGRFLFNASARFIVRVSPTWLRQWVYLKLLR